VVAAAAAAAAAAGKLTGFLSDGLPRRRCGEGSQAADHDTRHLPGDVPEILEVWHRSFGARVRQCEACGIAFTMTNTVGLGGCFIHEKEAGPDGTHPCCGFNPFRQCTPSVGWGGRTDFRPTEKRRRNYGNSIGCLAADHHSKELRRGSRTTWLVVVPEALLTYRPNSAVLAVGAAWTRASHRRQRNC
jgi:hypothetical protein